jgi:hypothetical protein
MTTTKPEPEHKITLGTYGLHWTEDGIAYLHQGRSSLNFLSLKAVSPFVVIPAKRMMCNHLFPTGAAVPDPMHWGQFQALARDPLVQAMLPLPKLDNEAGVYVMEDTNDEMTLTLLVLSRMSSPLAPIVRPIWHYSPSELNVEMDRTNVQPLVLTGANPKHQKLLNGIIEQARYSARRVIVTGTADLIVSKPAMRLRTALLAGEEQHIVSLPLEALGMTVLKRHARREDPLSDLPAPKGRGA